MAKADLLSAVEEPSQPPAKSAALQKRAKVDVVAPAPAAKPDVVSMIVAAASDPNVDVQKLEKLIDMQERWQRLQAESEFNQAFSVMQGELPTVVEKGRGDKQMAYAPIEDVMEAVRPVLQKHGFSVSHQTEWPQDRKGTVRIVGILSHRLGHSRTSVFESQADNSGSKNAIQALGSTITYGRRYTLNDLLGIVSRRGEDNDGATHRNEAAKEPEGYDEWLDALSEKATEGMAALTGMFNTANKDEQLKPFAAFLLKHDAGKWKALKEVAEKVKGGAR